MSELVDGLVVTNSQSDVNEIVAYRSELYGIIRM